MANRSGIRFLQKVWRNLPRELVEGAMRVPSTPTSIVQRQTPVTQVAPSALEARLQNIELLLQKLLTQKRVKVVVRDNDDLIERIIDQPLEGSDG